jgi:hypothetical protein
MNISIILPSLVSADKILHGNKVSGTFEVFDLTEFGEVACSHHITMATFKDNVKTKNTMDQIQIVGVDFDDGTTSLEIHQAMKSIANHVIIASANHNVDKIKKDGSISPACERFHLFFKLDRPITNANEYKDLVSWIVKINNWTPDPSCLEASRYYYKHQKVLYSWNDSVDLWVDLYQSNMRAYNDKMERLAKRKQDRELLKRIKSAGENTNVNQKSKSLNIHLFPIEKFKRTKYFPMLQHELGSGEGRRAKRLSIIGGMSACGMSASEAVELFNQYDGLGGSVSETTIYNLIK